MATFREELAAKIAPLLAPVPGASPGGADVSFDSEFEGLKAEIDKLSSVEQHEPRWATILEIGPQILTQKAKDMRVATWVGLALVRTHTWGGFAEALLLLDGLSRNYWDTMFPEVRRARGRVNAFTWLADLAFQHLQPKSPTAADGDAIRTSDEVLKELDALLAEKLGELYPGPGQLRSLLREKVRSIPEPAAAPPPAAPASLPTATSTPTAAPEAAPPPEPSPALAAPAQATSVDDVTAAVRENGVALMGAAEILRKADPTRPWAYRLQRWGAWIAIEEAPTVEDGRTRIPPPPKDTREELAALRDGQKWLDLLLAAEEATGTYRFWLDAHRMVAMAMDRLGPTFLAAREVVGREVASFLGRLPTVASLAFSEGTPFAEAGTRSWLDEEAGKLGGGGGSAAAAAASAEDEEVAKRFTEAEKLAAGGKVGEGLALAVALADRAADGRTRFRSRLAAGKMALDASKPELAKPLLEQLLADAERCGLESWEPSLCASLYACLLSATREVIRIKGGTPDLAMKEQYLFDRLCRVDPAGALKLSS